MQGDNHSANDDYYEKKNHQETDAQTKLFADNGKNEVGVRVGEIKHLLPAIAETESFHPAAAPREQRLHLLQTGILFEPLRIKKRREPSHSLRHLRRHHKNGTETGKRDRAEEDGIGSGDEHGHKSARAEEHSRAEIDLAKNERKQHTGQSERKSEAAQE